MLSSLAAGLLACGAVETPAAKPPAPPPPPPPPPAPAATVIPAQVFAEIEPDYLFTDPDRRKKIDTAFPAIDALVEAEVLAQKLPGAVLGVVVDGELVYAKGFGVADLQTKARPDADTVYRIGSITKSFTALTTLALRDEGTLTLDEPLARFIPEAGGLVYPTRDAPPITLRQILTHTSGLPRLGRFDYTRQDHELSEEEITRSLSGFALDSAPGSKQLYSNLGYGLLGIAIAHAAHTPLRALIGKKVLEPLGMTSTSWDHAGMPASRLATPYTRSLFGALVPTFTWKLGASEGAGGLYSTLRDMGRYVAFQLAAYPPRSASDNGPIRRSSVREAHFNALRSGGLHVERREDATPGESIVTASTGAYGYAWSVAETCDFDRIVRHNGAVAGFAATLSFLPESGVGVIALTNYQGDDLDLETVVSKALLALKKGGGLSKRIARVKVLPPAFASALPRLLAVQNDWSEEGYKAMQSKARGSVTGEQEELAGYKSTHGVCKGWKPIAIFSPIEARFAVECERGSFEMQVSLDPGDGLIMGFSGTSRDVTPPPPLATAAARLTGLIGKWEESIYKKLLAPKDAKGHDAMKAFFEPIRAAHGSCAVKSFSRRANQPSFTLGCDRGGDLTLTIKLDEKSEEVIASYGIRGEGGGTCPVK